MANSRVLSEEDLNNASGGAVDVSIIITDNPWDLHRVVFKVYNENGLNGKSGAKTFKNLSEAEEYAKKMGWSAEEKQGFITAVM